MKGESMTDTSEDNEVDVLNAEFSDEALEAAACPEPTAAYTQIAFCTVGVCPGG
jgi:hypothetical protein